MKLRILATTALFVFLVTVAIGAVGPIASACADDTPQQGGGDPDPPVSSPPSANETGGPTEDAAPDEVAQWLATTFVGSTLI